MVKRRKTRKKLKRSLRREGITRFIQKFEEGEKVVIYPEPSSHRGMPHPRFKGRVGIIKGMRGKSFIVEVKDGKKRKILVCRPEHLKPM